MGDDELAITALLTTVQRVHQALNERADSFHERYDFGPDTMRFSHLRLQREDGVLVLLMAGEVRMLLGRAGEFGTNELVLGCRLEVTDGGIRVSARFQALNDGAMGEYPADLHRTLLERHSAVLPPDAAMTEAITQLEMFDHLDEYARRLGLVRRAGG